MALQTFLRFGSRRATTKLDSFNLLDDLIPWQNAVDANAAKTASLGRRNVLRNGDLQITQRGAGPFTTTGYTADGWTKNGSGGTYSVAVAAAPLGGNRNALTCTTAGLTGAAGDFAVISQRIENVRQLAGQQVTLSFWATATVAGQRLGIEARQSFGTGGAPSADVSLPQPFVTLDTVAKRYSVTFTLPDLTGKTLGTTSGTDYLELLLWQAAGATYTARAGAVGTNNVGVTVWDLQLELGPEATAYERLPYSEQLAWCQRYFLTTNSAGRPYHVVGFGFAISATAGTLYLPAPVPMRAMPTLTVVGPFNLSDGVNAFGFSLSIDTGATTLGLLVLSYTSASLTQFRSYRLESQNNAAATVQLSAEL